MLEEFAPDLYVADGPDVPFFGIPYPTRMAIVRLAGGALWVWSPIRLTPELETAVEALGTPGHLVSPNKLHHLFLGDWSRRWPAAKVWASPGLARRRRDLRFDGELTGAPEKGWAADIDQAVVGGSALMDEVVFFHRPSATLLVCDLVQRLDGANLDKAWQRLFMRLDGLIGKGPATPLEWRLTFLRRAEARRGRARMLAWKPERLVIAHGRCAHTGAADLVATALAWM